MQTERLYYADSYLAEFTAQVSATAMFDGMQAVALDRSAFYPEGGGQPADQGTLNGSAVRELRAEGELIWHLLDVAESADLTVGAAVRGRLDWSRRFDHMQQHCGQHILTAAFIAACGAPTMAFHLSANSVTIDLDTPTLSADQVAQAEVLANSVIWEDQPINARFVSAAELATIALRKPPSVTDNVRVVSIGDFDHSACGGTHPRSTGGVGVLVVRGWSRQKGGLRVEFACGGRALSDYRRLNGVAGQAAAALSVGVDELPAAIAKIQATNEALRKELEQARAELLTIAAEGLYAEAEQAGTAQIVCRTETGGPERLRALAQQIAARPGGVALLGAAGERAHLVVACAADSGRDARAILQAGLPLVAGKGGGSPQLAQGGGPQVTGLEAALAALRAAARG
jgi:alanyl-tRNA synthetase